MKTINKKVVAKFREELEAIESPIAIIPHINADGDAIGSVLGLAGVLRNSGKKVVLLSPNHFPAYYKWMKGADEFLVFTTSKKKVENALASTGMMICLDFNQPSRAGEMESLVENYKGKSIMIDHHPFPYDFTDLKISHPECSSTAELVFHIIRIMGYQKFIDKDAAEAIYCGIMTDTGSFDYNISDPTTFKTISKLLTWSIDPEKIHDEVYNNYSADRMRLLGYCLNECMEVYSQYHTAMMYISKETQQKYKFLPGDNESFVNFPLSIKGIHFSVMFTEKDDHVKASFRSKGDFPVNEIAAKHFNGGGHKNAAGGELYIPFEEVLSMFRNLLPEYEEQLKKEIL